VRPRPAATGARTPCTRWPPAGRCTPPSRIGSERGTTPATLAESTPDETIDQSETKNNGFDLIIRILVLVGHGSRYDQQLERSECSDRTGLRPRKSGISPTAQNAAAIEAESTREYSRRSPVMSPRRRSSRRRHRLETAGHHQRRSGSAKTLEKDTLESSTLPLEMIPGIRCG